MEKAFARVDEIARELEDDALTTAGRVRLLEEGVAVLNELVRSDPGLVQADNARLEAWRGRLAGLQAAGLQAAARAAEERALQARAAGDAAGELAAWREAWEAQSSINGSGAGAEFRNLPNEVRLRQEIEKLGLRTLAREAEQAAQAGKLAAEAGHREEALAHYERALDLLKRADREQPRLAAKKQAERIRLGAEVAALRAAGLQARLEENLQRARQAAGEGRSEEAGSLLAAAMEQQRALNKDHAGTRFASAERLDQLEVERQTLRAAGVLQQVAELDRRAAEHLRRREVFQAQQLVRQALTAWEETRQREPRARGVDEELGARLAYLQLRADGLARVQDWIYDALRPMPADRTRALLASGVSQDLFSQMMNSNPSRQTAPDRPVDSVTHDEAVEFCRRLGWMLGRRVRLLDAAEAAASPPAGGVEWLHENEGDLDSAPVWRPGEGVRRAPRNVRDRAHHMRVVVEVDLAEPAR